MTIPLIILGAILLLVLGPFRRPLARNIRFVLPATLGALLGLGVGRYVTRYSGVSPTTSVVLCVVLALCIGASFGQAAKTWLDQVLERKEQDRDRHDRS